MKTNHFFADPKLGPRIVAHRGARSLAPENTLASFQKAFETGADAIECDVQLSKDGVPVVFHDYTLERCTNFVQYCQQKGQKLSPFLADWTLADLKALDAGSWFNTQDPFRQIQAGAVSKADQESFAFLTIPTLEEVLQLCQKHGLSLVLELKQAACPSMELVEKSVALLEAMQWVEKTVLISFEHTGLIHAKKIQPSLSTGALLVSRLADPGVYARDALGANLVSVYCPEHVFLRDKPATTYLAADVQKAHAVGIAYHVWTVNTMGDFSGLAQIGVDGIGTDFPQQLRAALNR